MHTLSPRDHACYRASTDMQAIGAALWLWLTCPEEQETRTRSGHGCEAQASLLCGLAPTVISKDGFYLLVAGPFPHATPVQKNQTGSSAAAEKRRHSILATVMELDSAFSGLCFVYTVLLLAYIF